MKLEINTEFVPLWDFRVADDGSCDLYYSDGTGEDYEFVENFETFVDAFDFIVSEKH